MYIVNLIPAEGWPMPFAAPNAMVPVRLELRGSYNNNQTRFHAVGDYVNFLPTPPTNLDNVQVGIYRIRMYRYSFTWVIIEAIQYKSNIKVCTQTVYRRNPSHHILHITVSMF